MIGVLSITRGIRSRVPNNILSLGCKFPSRHLLPKLQIEKNSIITVLAVSSNVNHSKFTMGIKNCHKNCTAKPYIIVVVIAFVKCIVFVVDDSSYTLCENPSARSLVLAFPHFLFIFIFMCARETETFLASVTCVIYKSMETLSSLSVTE